MASWNDILSNLTVLSKYFGSAFNIPGTSFQIVTEAAFKQYAKIPAVKSDPSRPNVVVNNSGVCPKKPCVIAIVCFSNVGTTIFWINSSVRFQLISASRYMLFVRINLLASSQVVLNPL